MRIKLTALDSKGKPIEGAAVKLSGPEVLDKETNAEGKIETELLPVGEYDIKISYINNLGEKCEISSKASDTGAQSTSDMKVKPNNIDDFRCSMCPIYEKYKPVPIVGWFVALVHMFVHMAAHISHVD